MNIPKSSLLSLAVVLMLGCEVDTRAPIDAASADAEARRSTGDAEGTRGEAPGEVLDAGGSGDGRASLDFGSPAVAEMGSAVQDASVDLSRDERGSAADLALDGETRGTPDAPVTPWDARAPVDVELLTDTPDPTHDAPSAAVDTQDSAAFEASMDLPLVTSVDLAPEGPTDVADPLPMDSSVVDVPVDQPSDLPLPPDAALGAQPDLPPDVAPDLAADAAPDLQPDVSPDTVPLTSTIWLSGNMLNKDKRQFGKYEPQTTNSTDFNYVLPSGSVAAVAPDGSKVAFACDGTQAGRFDLCVMNADGTGLRVLVQMPAFGDVERLRFSRDGVRLAFEADFEVDGQKELYAVETGAPAPAQPRRLTPPRDAAWASAQVSLFAWDWGSRVAIVAPYNATGKQELYTVDAAATVPVPVVAVPHTRTLITGVPVGILFFLDWTMTGQVVFAGRLDPDRIQKLYRVSPDGSGLTVLPGTVLPAGAPVDILGAAVSADGSRIAFPMQAPTSGTDDVYVLSLTGANPMALRVTPAGAVPTGWTTVPMSFVWSPDGTKIAFSARYDGTMRLEPWVVSASGGGVLRLAQISRDFYIEVLAWAPDSNAIAFVTAHVHDDPELFRVLNVTQADQVPITVHGVPTGGSVASVAWTR